MSGTFRQLPPTFRAAAGPSVNFCQLFVHLQDLLPTIRASAGPSVNFCVWYLEKTFRSAFRQLCQLSIWPRDIP